MPLLDRIQQDLKSAMLARDADRLSTLRLLKSAIGYAQIERKNENLPEAEIVSINAPIGSSIRRVAYRSLS